MRFSLATLVLLVLWIGALMAVWVRREPWVIDFESPYYEHHNILNSPDGWRTLPDILNAEIANHALIVEERIANDSPQIWRYDLDDDKVIWSQQFEDDDTISFDWLIPGQETHFGRMRRRFPEWWWGHFYRPEVWLSIVLSALLIWRAIRARRSSQPFSATSVSSAPPC